MITTEIKESIDKLTPLQQERYSSIYHRYVDESILIVTTRKTRGRNSFPSIINNSNIVNNASDPHKGYYEALTNEFERGRAITYHTLIQKVCAQRAKFNHSQFTSNILQSCLDEMAKVYFFEEGTYNNDTNIIIGVKPLVKLMVI